MTNPATELENFEGNEASPHTSGSITEDPRRLVVGSAGLPDGLPPLSEPVLTHTDGIQLRYLATQPHTSRRVEVTVLTVEASTADALTMARDISLGGQLSGHSAIVPILEAGLTKGGYQYRIVPHYRRGSLARFVANNGRLGWREATFFTEQIAVAVAEIHGCSIVHANMNPDSIMLTDFLLPRVGAFGHSASAGSILSKPLSLSADPYRAPELAGNNAVGRQIETTADVYSLAAILWTLLAGSRPGWDDGASNVVGAETGRVPNIPAPTDATPAPIIDLLHRSLHLAPSQRPANAAAFVTELRRATSGSEPDPTGNAEQPSGVKTSFTKQSASTDRPKATTNGADVASVANLEQTLAGGLRTPQGKPDRSGSDNTDLDVTPRTDARYVLLLVTVIMFAVTLMITAVLMATPG